MTTGSSLTPAKLGFRMPAEWEPHRATWLSWPWNTETWPDRVSHVEHAMARWVRELTRERRHLNNGRPLERVEILVLGKAHREHVQAILETWDVPMERVGLHMRYTNDAWIRDYGPIFVTRAKDLDDGFGRVAVTDWRFDGWGGKGEVYYGGNVEADNGVPREIAGWRALRTFTNDAVLEGGSIDTNGEGAMLTTRSCVLNHRERSGGTQDEARLFMEQQFQEFLGVEHVIWLDGVSFEGDDTDGHIDNLARFVAPTTILTVITEDMHDPLFEPLKMNLEKLQQKRTNEDELYRVLTLPMPGPVYQSFNRDGDEPEHNERQRLPASYMNFYIGNHVVLVPTYADRHDRDALNVLQSCFPDRDVVGVDCGDYILGLGAIHCSTQQEPLAE